MRDLPFFVLPRLGEPPSLLLLGLYLRKIIITVSERNEYRIKARNKIECGVIQPSTKANTESRNEAGDGAGFPCI